MTEDLAGWLLEQIAQDEQDAERWSGVWPRPGVRDNGSVWLHIRPGGNAVVTHYRHPAEGYDDMAKLRAWSEPDGQGWHRERVLAECDAKRRMVAEAKYWYDKVNKRENYPALSDRFDVAFGMLRFLALPYADRPGYRPEWKP
jgi:hypothetical protein